MTSREFRFQFRDLLLRDARLMGELCVRVPDLSGRRGIVPFRWNSGQVLYDERIIRHNKPRVIVAKSRKLGFSTQQIWLQKHGAMSNIGRIARAYTHRQQATRFLGSLLRTMYRELVQFFTDIGDDPYFYVPKQPASSEDSATIFEFPEINSGVYLETAGGQGVGQADRTDDAYLTEYQAWRDAEDSFGGIVGSMPIDTDHSRLTIDFNAEPGWMGTDAYAKWDAARKGPGDPDWNGFTPFFCGVQQVPEVYPVEKLLEKRRTMGDYYALSYPEKPEDMELQRGRNVHKLEEVNKALERSGGKYLADILPDYHIHNPRLVPIRHGVDTATGREDGDFQVMFSWGWHPDYKIWWQLCPAIRERIPEDVFAERVDAQVRKYPGKTVVERNVGGAVIICLRNLGTPGLYKHKHRDKTHVRREIGFPMTYPSKRNMIRETNQMLREGTLAIVDEWVVREFREVEWKTKNDDEDAAEIAGAPDRKGCYDDGWIAAQLGLQG